MINEKKLIEELKKRVRTPRSTMEILRDIIPLIERQPKVCGQTNADKIRNMTDEDLAEFLRKVKADYQWSDPEFPDVDDDWIEWIQSEVEENDEIL